MEKLKSRLKIFGAGILMFAMCLCGMVFLPKVENSNICTTASVSAPKSGVTRITSNGTLPEGATDWTEVLNLTQGTNADKSIYWQVNGLKSAYSNISVLDLPDEIDGIPIERFNPNYAFHNNLNLTSITIPQFIVNPGDQLGPFLGCKNIAEINYNAINCVDANWNSQAFKNAGMDTDGIVLNIGPNVTRIPGYLFGKNGSSNYVKIKQVNFAENSMCTEIGNQAFLNCLYLEEINIPENLVTIGTSAFSACTSLAEITIPETVTSIGDSVFYNCASLESVQLPSGITSIAASLFYGCTALKNVNIPSGVTSIATSAFESCKSLTTITIPELVISVGGAVFRNCTKLEVINFNSRSFTGTTFTDYNYFLYAGSETDGITLNIGSNVTKMPSFLFHSNVSSVPSYIKTINFAPNDVLTTIGDRAFGVAKKLTTINYNLTNCTSVKNTSFTFAGQESGGVVVNIGANVKSVPNNIFCADTADNYDNIIEVNFAQNSECATIGSSAFNGCKNLKEIAIPESVTILDGSAFANCTSLNEITILDGITAINSSAFANCTSLAELTIPESVTTLGAGIVSGCTNLTFFNYNATNVTTTNAVVGNAGNEADGLIINIGENVATIPSNFANGATYLKEITIPENVISIGTYAFYNCVYLELIKFNAKSCANMVMNNNVFRYAGQSGKGITLIIGNLVEKIPSYLFYPVNDNINYADFAPNLTKVSFDVEKSVCTEIGTYAFYRCINLKEVTIPKSITTIGAYAFNTTNLLEEVYFYANACADFASAVFAGAGKEADTFVVNVGSNVERIPNYLFYNANLSEVKFTGQSICSYIGKNAFNGNSRLTEAIVPDSVEIIGESAYANCSSVGEITIPEKVKSIEKQAFIGCTALEVLYYNAENCANFTQNNSVFGYAGQSGDGFELNIGNKVKNIPTYFMYPSSQDTKFTYTPKLTAINFAEDGGVIKTIGNYAFYECIYLEEITIPETITSMGVRAFAKCNMLETINYNAIECSSTGWDGQENAFSWSGTGEDCVGITLNVGKNVKTLPNYIFGKSASYTSYFVNIVNINFEEGSNCESIGTYAFGYCKNLIHINLPQSVTSIATYAFLGCSALQEIVLPNNLQTIEANTFEKCAGLIEVNIPQGVVTIGASAFLDCSSLATVTISDSVTTIGTKAFSNCTSLAEFTIPVNITKVGNDALTGCANLSLIKYNAESASAGQFIGTAGSETKEFIVLIGNKVKKIPTYFGQNSLYVTELKFEKDSVCEIIYEHVFQDATKLKKITIPESVKSMTTTLAADSFAGCSALEEIRFNAINCVDPNDNYNRFFQNAGKNGNGIVLYIGNKVTRIPVKMFHATPKITKIIFEENSVCASIGRSAFEGCSYLQELNIPESVETIGSQAFAGASRLEVINFNAETCVDLCVAGLGSNPVFSAVGQIIGGATLKIGKMVTRIPGGIFWAKTTDYTTYNDIRTIEFAEDGVLSEIGNYAFAYNVNLEEINLPNTIKTVGSYAFQNCTGLKGIIIPSSTEAIGGSAFVNCTEFTEITIPKSVVSIGASIVSGCTGITTINYNAIDCTSTNAVFTGVGSANVGVIINIGNEVVSIAKNLCSGAINIKTLNFAEPCKVSSVGAGAFMSTALTEIEIPASIVSIDANAFFTSKTGLKVTFKGAVEDGTREFIPTLIAVTAFNAAYGYVPVVDLDKYESASFYKNKKCFVDLIALDFNLTFVYNDGAVSNVVIQMHPAEDVSLDPYRPTRDNYEFVGWYLSPLLLDEELITSTTSILKTTTLYARYLYTGDWSEMYTYSTDGQVCINGIKEDKASGVVDIVIPASDNLGNPVLGIADYTFKGSLIQSLAFEEGCTLEEIGEGAFVNSLYLTNVDFANADSLQDIGTIAFKNCGLAGELVLPENIESFGASVLEDNRITSFVVDNDTFTTENGIVYSSDFKTLVLAPNILESDIVVNENTEEILGFAFVGNDGMVTITGDNVKRVGSNSFADSTLEYFEFPMLQTIDTSAFEGANLKTVKLAKSVSSIGDNAFTNNTGLVGIVIEGIVGNSRLEAPTISNVIADNEESILVYVPVENLEYYKGSDWARFTLVSLEGGKQVWKVTIDLDGGSGYSNIYFVVGGETIDLSVNPTKIGFVFVKWQQVKNGEYLDFSDTTPIEEDTDIIAIWQIIDYEINYIINGGYIEDVDTNIQIFHITDFGSDFDEVIEIKTPIREGYTFIGWYTNDEFDSAKVRAIEYGKLTYNQILAVEGIYLYAKWEINKFEMLFEESTAYTVALDNTTQNPVPWGSNFGFMIALSESYSQNSVENVIVKLYKADKSTLVTELQPEVTDITDLHYKVLEVKEAFYIKVEGLKINTYKVYFVTGEDKTGAENMPETIEVEWGKSITSSVTSPTLTGYSFESWHSRIYEDDLEKVDANPFDFATPIYSDTTLIAKFNVVEYEITLHLNGATLNGNNIDTFVINYTIEDEVMLPTGRSQLYYINKRGYTIDGWYSDFTIVNGEYFIDKSTNVEVVIKGTTGDLEFVLDFDEIVYTITYDPHGGNYNGVLISEYTINTETFELTPITRSGYSFLGWFTNEAEPYVKVVRIEKGSTQNYILHALWQANEYKIIYHLNGTALSRVEIQGSLITHTSNKLEVSYEYGIYETYYLETATRKGYTFDGWYETEDFVGNAVYSIPNVAITEDKNFYAKWNTDKYTINFNYSHLYTPERVETREVTSLQIEENEGRISLADIIPNPVLDGYTFLGWYIGDEKITSITLDNAQEEMTLMAVFNVNKVSVTLKGDNTKDIISLYYEDNVVNNIDYGTTLTFELKLHDSSYEQSFKNVKVSYSYDDQDYIMLQPEGKYYTVDKVTDNIFIKVEGLELNKYTVRFITNEGSSVPDITNVVHGEKITAPTNPTRSGYNFAGWYVDNGLNTAFDFINQQIIRDTHLYAKWDASEYKAILKNNINDDFVKIDFDIDNQANIILDDYNFAIAGYKFVNYYLVKDGDADNYKFNDADIIRNLASIHESVVILAKFEIITYNIIYGLESGITNPNRTTYTIETDDFELSPVKKDLFVFEGWIDSNTKEKVEVIAKGTTGDIFLIATFRLESLDYVSVKYFAMNTEYVYAEVAVKIGESVGTTHAPKQIDGYKFAGWYTDLSFENEFNENLIILETTRVYAKYDLETYKINYTSNIGNNFSNPTENKKQVTIVDEFNLVAPSKTGYTFVGWYKGVEIDMSGNYNFDNATLVTMIIGQKEQIALCAKFELNTYEITYVLNGGEITEELTYTFNVESNVITLPATISKVGYNFNGWVDKNGDAIEKIQPSIAENVEVRAIFTAIEYTIEYVDEHIEDGDVSAGNPTRYTIDSMVSVLKNNTVLGYKFIGWFDGQGNKVESIGGGDRRIGNLVLTAKYELIEYTITYILNDGIMINPNPTSYTIESEFILNSPSKENGYTFTKWTIEGTDGDVIEKIIPGMSGNLVLIANYEYVNNYYVVTYYINENTYLFDSVEKDHALNKVVEPIKTNYIFEGWYLDAELTNKADSSTIVRENMSLYAKFVAEAHNIYYSFVDTEGNVINGIANNNDSIFSVEKLVVFNAPVLHGYTFIGFNYNGTNIDNTFGIYEDINIAGVFSLNTYTISYVLGGGQAENIGSYTIKDQNVTLNNASKNNAEFLGWYDSITDEKVTVIDTSTARDYILVAKWKEIEVVIEKDTAGSAGDIIFIVVCVFIVLSMVIATIYMVLEKVNANKKSAKVKRAESILPPKPTDTFSNYGDTRPFQFDDRATSGDGSEFISHRDDDIDSNY